MKARSPVDLACAVSHELRQPLASIRGYTEMLLSHWDDFPDGDKKDMLKEVLYDAERVGRLVDELLEANRLGSGRIRLHRRDTDLSIVLARALRNLELSYPGLDAVVDLSPSFPVFTADPFKLEQVVANLLENACKYGSPAGIRIECSWRPGPGGGVAEVRVCDRGAGISPGELPHVTEKFYRGAQAPPGGLGLGLWISKGIVEAHGGQLVASSTPGWGTTVSFTIPGREVAGTGKLAPT